ncbi:hypothetical protein [Armatimonas sp.]|uniref:hypothetical protein n=1 Tax=Armatimonas sp. TaxID=1872638 RepID=UPI00374D7973
MNRQSRAGSLKRGKLPTIRLGSQPPITDAQAGQIRGLIAQLAAINKPYFGLSGTLSGSGFAPLEGQESSGAFLLTNHALSVPESLKTLVALGAKALPFLLEALDNPTPTQLTIKAHPSGGMFYEMSLHHNPVNSAEQGISQSQLTQARAALGKDIPSYTVTVGDVCFVILGQIVGREYQAIRYQPTLCIVVNSPVHDPALCATVRSIWRSDNPMQKLFNSLCEDYASVGVYDKKSLDDWDAADALICGAALRLLYYFPQEATALLVKRLDDLKAGKDRDVDAYIRRCIANGGVRSENLLKALTWSKSPAVRAAITRVFRRTNNSSTLKAALPSVDDIALIRHRLEPHIAALPRRNDEDGPYGDGYNFLLALCKRTPSTTEAVFSRYLRGARPERCYTACLILREVRVTWATKMLAPLLSDKRTWGYEYAVEKGKNKPCLPIRVCDEAAITLCASHPKLMFVQQGTHAALDAQIATLRAALALR